MSKFFSTDDWLQRTRILLDDEALEKLASAHILLAGAGGVGGYAAEALVRSGIGSLTVYDPDRIHPTNRNRQLLALCSTQNQYKVEVLTQRVLDINPDLQLMVHPEALTMDNITNILSDNNFDYVVDAIDSIHEKCFLLATACQMNIPVISAMGAGCRLDPTQIKYADISKTYGCPLAKNVRSRLKKEYNITRGIDCVFSSENRVNAVQATVPGERPLIGSSSFMPGIFGLFMAARVINRLSGNTQ